MNVLPLKIPGALELRPALHTDCRGRFVKTFHIDEYRRHGLACEYQEEYFSESVRGVVRGLHFQVPPMDHEKLVYCVSGAVVDVILDIRRGSPTYGQYELVRLTAEQGNMVYLARGLAHGFGVMSSLAVMVYKVTSVYSPLHDRGVLWNSAGIPWPLARPIVSPRDQGFPTLAELDSPFHWCGAQSA